MPLAAWSGEAGSEGRAEGGLQGLVLPGLPSLGLGQEWAGCGRGLGLSTLPLPLQHGPEGLFQLYCIAQQL